MRTKSLPGGHWFDYVEGPKDCRGDLRELAPRRLRGDRPSAERLLRALEPGWVTDCDEKHRRLLHNRKHLIHLTSNFSESRAKVESVLPQVIYATESLFLAGLPVDALRFIWYEHPQIASAHAHCGLLRTLLYRGVLPYEAGVSSKLTQLFDRLVSHRLGLADQEDPAHALPIRAGDYSYKREFRPQVHEVLELTSSLLKSCGRSDYREFLRLLEQELASLRYKILAVPDASGRAQKRPEAEANPRVRCYWKTMAIQTPQGDLLYFKGPVCSPDFNSEIWAAKLDTRSHEHSLFKKYPQPTYRHFMTAVRQLIQDRKNRYHVQPAQPLVLAADFAWLDPGLGEAKWQQLLQTSLDRRGEQLCAIQPSAAPALPAIQPGSFDQDLRLVADRYYPFICEPEPYCRDITNPSRWEDELFDDQALDLPEETLPDAPIGPVSSEVTSNLGDSQNPVVTPSSESENPVKVTPMVEFVVTNSESIIINGTPVESETHLVAALLNAAENSNPNVPPVEAANTGTEALPRVETAPIGGELLNSPSPLTSPEPPPTANAESEKPKVAEATQGKPAPTTAELKAEQGESKTVVAPTTPNSETGKVVAEPQWAIPPAPTPETSRLPPTPKVETPEIKPPSQPSANTVEPKLTTAKLSEDQSKPKAAPIQATPPVDAAVAALRLWLLREKSRRYRLQLQICLQEAQDQERTHGISGISGISIN